jgi:hypothetical protein
MLRTTAWSPFGILLTKPRMLSSGWASRADTTSYSRAFNISDILNSGLPDSEGNPIPTRATLTSANPGQ